MKKRIIAVAATVMAVGITAAIGGGMWQTLPIVAAQAYCAVISTGIGSSNSPFLVPPGSTQGTSTSICQVTVPAGPTILTGNEVVPADTFPASSPYLTVPQGFNPATVGVPIILLDSGAYQYSTANQTAANFSLTNPINFLILDGPVGFTAVNVTLPGTSTQPALNGQQFHLVSSKSIMTLLISGALGTSITNAPTQLIQSSTPSNGMGFSFIYDSTISTWFRVQ